MANTIQARKRARQNEKRRAHNMTLRSKMRTVVRKAEATIATGDKKQAPEAFKSAMAALHKAAGKGLIKKTTAARKISRLAARVRANS